ncbi:HTH domain-containing protein [Methylobacterium sp. R2-1]|uniref:HTH domain-containing protein n=1 Tax=Methylobacterium sp. R2-1 TaxID=2587064 RepID=UPI0016215DE3|nr:HTH domain-containing protein [Methylobacterium sp. R2-1]MBB2964472.1 putative NUDIX family phosphoesterase [Methylobacterium sp. R2-1]
MTKPTTFLTAAYEILRQFERPMTVAEIIHEARSRGILVTDGKTPVKTLNARLSVDILRLKGQSRFMRSDGSRFALREWNHGIQERIVPRRTVALTDEEILAFDASLLRRFVQEDGFKRGDETHQELLASCFSIKRSDAEERYDIIQLISVYVVRCYQDFLTYKRSRRLPEGRLHNTYSCFFGGHLTAADLMPLFRFSDPEQALYLLDRELTEELRLPAKPEAMDFRGLLYDPRTDVSRQHIGIVFCVDVPNQDFTIGEKGFLTDAKFESIQQMRSRLSQFENWSEYLIQKEIVGWN